MLGADSSPFAGVVQIHWVFTMSLVRRLRCRPTHFLCVSRALPSRCSCWREGPSPSPGRALPPPGPGPGLPLRPPAFYTAFRSGTEGLELWLAVLAGTARSPPNSWGSGIFLCPWGGQEGNTGTPLHPWPAEHATPRSAGSPCRTLYGFSVLTSSQRWTRAANEL